MTIDIDFTRRRFLRGATAMLALPWLESLAGRGGRSAKPPVRMAWLVMPNGVLPSAWEPEAKDGAHVLSPTLEPLRDVFANVTIFGGLWNAGSRDGDGHYAKVAPLLTCRKIRRTGGRDLLNGVSADQLAAKATEGSTLIPSLELGTEPVRSIEDMGFSTVYGGHVSWRTPTEPVAKEIVPRLVFDRLTRASSLRAEKSTSSVLDVVKADAARLRRVLSAGDRSKLEEYEESVRALERRIAAAESAPRISVDGAAPPPGVPGEFSEHLRLMLDLIVMAFRTDLTRIVTFLMGNEVSGRDFSFLEGVKGSHHELSHHEDKPEKTGPYALINRWYVSNYAYLIRRLAEIREGDGTLLDHSMIVFLSAMRDGNKHDPHDLPILLGGRGDGTIEGGRYKRSKADTPLANLWLGMLRRFGVDLEKFGDSTAPLI